MAFIPISAKASSIGNPTMVITATDLSESYTTCMVYVIICLVGAPINLTVGIFTTGTGLSAYIFSFVNITTGRWSALYFTITQFASNDNYVDAFYA